MNAFEKLKIELGGIEGTISTALSEPISRNYIEQLKQSVEAADYHGIVYILEELEQWYNEQYPKFSSQSTYSIHMRTLTTIQEIRRTLTEEDCVVEHSEVAPCEKTIFISHKSDDKKYGNALRNFIIGLGVTDQQLIYTSHPLNKIPLGANIYDYLRNHINSSVFMIVLWSDKYLESPACLNEMGAAWVVQADYTNLYVPDFSFGNPKYHQCAVDTSKMGAVLNGDLHCKENMLELKDKILSFFNLPNNEKKNSYLIDTFVSEIK